MTRGNGFKQKKHGVSFQYQEEILNCEGGEALEQAAQRNCGCPIPGSLQGHSGWGFEQTGLVEASPAYAKGGELNAL